MGGVQSWPQDTEIHGGQLMPTWAAWIIGIILCLLVGAVIGYGAGATATRDTIANECRQSSAFTVGRIGFKCEARNAQPRVEY